MVSIENSDMYTSIIVRNAGHGRCRVVIIVNRATSKKYNLSLGGGGISRIAEHTNDVMMTASTHINTRAEAVMI